MVLSGSNKVSSSSSMTNQTSHYGIMGGLAPSTNVAQGVKRFRLRRARNQQTIPLMPVPGLQYMQQHDILSKNPAGSGGVGLSKVLVDRSMGPCNCGGGGGEGQEEGSPSAYDSEGNCLYRCNAACDCTPNCQPCDWPIQPDDDDGISFGMYLVVEFCCDIILHPDSGLWDRDLSRPYPHLNATFAGYITNLQPYPNMHPSGGWINPLAPELWSMAWQPFDPGVDPPLNILGFRNFMPAMVKRFVQRASSNYIYRNELIDIYGRLLDATDLYNIMNIQLDWTLPSGIKDFNSAFRDFAPTNGKFLDISSWNVADGESFNGTFSGATSFDAGISEWNVSNGLNFSNMFSGATSFTCDISDWDVSKGTNFSNMFSGVTINSNTFIGWNVSKGENFSQMFSGATFADTGSNRFLYSWEVGNGTNFSGMFQGATNFNGVIGSWNVGKGQDFSQMFSGASAFNQDIGSWNVGKGQNFSYMFGSIDTPGGAVAGAKNFNGDISSWNVGKGDNFSYMFRDASSFEGAQLPLGSTRSIGIWDVSNGTNFSYMFSGATSFDADIGAWNVSKGINFSWMFEYATAFNQDLADWEPLKPTSMRGMFMGASSFNQDLSKWGEFALLDPRGLTTVRDFRSMFYDATSFDQNLKWKIRYNGQRVFPPGQLMFRNNGCSGTCGVTFLLPTANPRT